MQGFYYLSTLIKTYTMKNYKLCRITPYRFTARFCTIARQNNVKTVGKMETASLKSNLLTPLRRQKINQEIREFKQSY